MTTNRPFTLEQEKYVEMVLMKIAMARQMTDALRQ
jgi:hypothetical protein